jgi:hypothetical protein
MVPSPDGQGVIIFGGSASMYGYQSSMYKLICDQLGCKWSKMEQHLQKAREFSVAMMIPNNLTNCTKT